MLEFDIKYWIRYANTCVSYPTFLCGYSVSYAFSNPLLYVIDDSLWWPVVGSALIYFFL